MVHVAKIKIHIQRFVWFYEVGGKSGYWRFRIKKYIFGWYKTLFFKKKSYPRIHKLHEYAGSRGFLGSRSCLNELRVNDFELSSSLGIGLLTSVLKSNKIRAQGKLT